MNRITKRGEFTNIILQDGHILSSIKKKKRCERGTEQKKANINLDQFRRTITK